MTRVKQLFRYAGNKAKLLTTYAPFFDGLHPQYCVDYFGGSGTMSLWFHQLCPEAKLYLNELDLSIYQLWMCIKDRYEEFCVEVQHIIQDYAKHQRDLDTKKGWYYRVRNAFYNKTQDPEGETRNDRRFTEWGSGCVMLRLSHAGKKAIPNLWYPATHFTEEDWKDITPWNNTPSEHAWFYLLRLL